MAHDQFGSYAGAVDALVDQIVALREAPSADGGLLSYVNAYADRARDVMGLLLERSASEATTARVLALAAGDFRLAASLVVLDAVPVTEADELAQQSDLREELANLSDDMAEIKAAVIDEPEGSDGGGGSGVPRPNGPSPRNPNVPNVVFPWSDDVVSTPAHAAAWETPSALGLADAAGRFVIRGGAPNPSRVQLVAKEIDKIVDNAAGQIGGLVIGGIPFAVESAAELSELAAGSVPGSYKAFQGTLAGLARRAKRAAVKLLYEAIEKLLRIFRSAIPQHSPVPIANALAELASWLTAFALKTKIRNGLEGALQVDALRCHAKATLDALPASEAECRAWSVLAVGNAYAERKIQLPIDCGRVALRACRVFKLQHVAPPVSQIIVGCVTLGLCGLSGWLAQDFLDHPPVRFVPQMFPGVLSAVDGCRP